MGISANEIAKRKLVEEQNTLLSNKVSYSNDTVECKIENARYMINHYYRDNNILAIDKSSSKFLPTNVLNNEIEKMIMKTTKDDDDSTTYYDKKTLESVKKLIEKLDKLYTLEV